jgi:hypothetical protein
VDLLRQVWGQQDYQDNGVLHWRAAQHLPPASLRSASPSDLDARDSAKQGQPWRGDTVPLTDTGEDEAPPVLTPVETPRAPDQAGTVVDPRPPGLADHALLPAVPGVDGAYGARGGLVASHHDDQGARPGPRRQEQRWQAPDEQACDTRPVVLAWDQEGGTCPHGTQRRDWPPATGPRGQPTRQGLFHKKDGAGCGCVLDVPAAPRARAS